MKSNIDYSCPNTVALLLINKIDTIAAREYWDLPIIDLLQFNIFNIKNISYGSVYLLQDQYA